VEPFPPPQPDPDRLCLEINAVVLQTLLCGLMGAGFAAISVLWGIGSRLFPVLDGAWKQRPICRFYKAPPAFFYENRGCR